MERMDRGTEMVIFVQQVNEFCIRQKELKEPKQENERWNLKNMLTSADGGERLPVRVWLRFTRNWNLLQMAEPRYLKMIWAAELMNQSRAIRVLLGRQQGEL